MNGGPLNQKAGMFILLVDDNDVVKDAVVNMTASEISSQFTNVSVDSIEGWSGDAIMTDGSQYINVQRINANIDTDSKDDWTYGHTSNNTLNSVSTSYIAESTTWGLNSDSTKLFTTNNVGIGTIDPNYPLSVLGNIESLGTSSNEWTNQPCTCNFVIIYKQYLS